jgi:hypothetical protein
MQIVMISFSKSFLLDQAAVFIMYNRPVPTIKQERGQCRIELGFNASTKIAGQAIRSTQSSIAA